MPTFVYHPDVLARFPGICGGVILARGLRNGPTPEPLRAAYAAEQQAVLARLDGKALSEIPSLAAWRSAFRAFGVEPTQYRSAAEALLRRLTKKGDIPTINLLTDLGNLVSIRYALPVAVLDMQAIQGAVTVRFADGSEQFFPLGQSAPEHPEPGEVIFADEGQRVVARRWCWRQSDDSAAQPATTTALFTVEAHHTGARADIQAALDDLLDLLNRHAGGDFIWDILGPARAAF